MGSRDNRYYALDKNYVDIQDIRTATADIQILINKSHLMPVKHPFCLFRSHI